MILVTGASGQLGRLVVDALLESVPAERIVAGVRDPAKASDLAARGVQIRRVDYDAPDTLDTAFGGVSALLLISSDAVGQRAAQHRAVIEAATRAKVGSLAYTSLLHADRSPLSILADEHRQTEALIKASGLPYTLLRNGWYNENYQGPIASAVQQGQVIGSAGDGRIAAASRADYAAAAAVVLRDPAAHAGRTYELAGDDAFTLTQLAAEIARQSGQPVSYQNLTPTEYVTALEGVGVPKPFAELLADSDRGAAQGGLFDDSRALSRLIGRPTTAIAVTVADTLRAFD